MSAIRQNVREWGPTALFAISLVVGSATIWIGKLYDANIYVVTAVPVGLMFLYAGVNFLLPGLRVRNEQTGDNLYYMGFVFTLMSLGISLYKFTGEASIEDIVRNFGIAIISTVSGIMLRIAFNQMRRDPADIENAVRTELAELTRKVRTELDSSALEFSSYRRTSNQMLSEGFEEIARQAEKNGEAVRAAIEAMSLQATQTLKDTADRLVATLEQTHRQIAEIAEKNVGTAAGMTERLETAVEKLTARAEGLGGAMDTVAQKYASARSPEEMLRIDVAPAVEALRAVVESNAKAISENAVGTRDATKKVLSALTPFKQTAASLNQLTGKLEQINDTSDRSVEALSDILAKVADAVTATQDATKVQVRASEQIAKLADTMVAASENSNRLIEAQSQAQTERIERVLSTLNTNASDGESLATASWEVGDNGTEIHVDGITHPEAESVPVETSATDDAHASGPSVPEPSDVKEERSRWSIFQR